MRPVLLILPALLALAPSASADEPTTPSAPSSSPDTPSLPTAEVSLVHATNSLDLRTGQAQRTLIVQADLNIAEDSNVVGMSHQIDLTELRAGSGEDLLAAWRKTGQIVFGGPRHFGPVMPHRTPTRGGAISLSTSLNGLPYIPPAFKVVRGKAYVLLATSRVVREAGPVAEGAMAELAPSLVVQLLQVKREGINLQVQFRYDAEQPAPFFNPNIRPPFVDSVRLIDDKGAQTVGHGGVPQQSDPRKGLFEGEGQLLFNLPEGRQPAAIRFDVVTALEEREVQFIAHDVAMPIEP